MVLVWAILGAVLVFGIAAVAIGREAFRLGHEPPPTVVDVDEAVAFVAERLDDERAARLTLDEARSLVRWFLEHLRRRGVSSLPGEEVRRRGEAPVVVDDDAVAAVLGAADDAGLEVDDTDVLVVLDLVLAYFEEVGAVGPPAGAPPDRPPPSGNGRA